MLVERKKPLAEGFKNVSLGNVLRARSGNKDTPFIAAEDQAIYLDKQTASFQVQVALHELLGHGSGKVPCLIFILHACCPDTPCVAVAPTECRRGVQLFARSD